MGGGRGHFSSLPDWEQHRLIGLIPGGAHGIASQLWRLQHRYIPGRAAREELYVTEALSATERNRARAYLVRHADACYRLAGHPWFPRNRTTAPDVNNQAWWVVDEWVEGDTLAERLDDQEFPPPRAPCPSSSGSCSARASTRGGSLISSPPAVAATRTPRPS